MFAHLCIVLFLLHEVTAVKPEAVKGQSHRDRCLNYFLIATYSLWYHFYYQTGKANCLKKQYKKLLCVIDIVCTAIKHAVLHKSGHENHGREK